MRIQNLEALRQVRHLEVRAQKTVAQAVEGANPHAMHVDRQHAGEPRHHFLGGLVGKGHRQNAAGSHQSVLQQPGDACGEHARLARARAGQDQGVLGWQGHGGALLRVQGLEQRRFSCGGGRGEKGHGVIVGSWQDFPAGLFLLCCPWRSFCSIVLKTCLHGWRQSNRVPGRPPTAGTHKSATPVPGPSARCAAYCLLEYQSVAPWVRTWTLVTPSERSNAT